MTSKKAIIIGGSLSGLFAALMLRNIGWEVDVFERSSAVLHSRGGGILLRPQVIELFKRLGLHTDDMAGVPARERVVLADDGHVARHIPIAQVHSSWNAIYSTLRDELGLDSYHKGANLFWVFQTPDHVTATFADGQRAEADLLLGADGLRSTVRAQCFGDIQPRYAGYVAWRGLAPERMLDAETVSTLQNRLAMFEAPSSHILSYPVANEYLDTERGKRLYNWVWYRPADVETELPILLTDRNGVRHTSNVAPGELAADVETRMRHAAESTLCPPMRALVAATRQPFVHTIFDLSSERMAAGRVALIGEAAFAARPHTGASTSKAAANVLALTQSLMRHRNSIEETLREWESSQLRVGTELVEYGRRLWTDPGGPNGPHLP